LIFDVGANKGNKTAVFLRLGARVVAVEPDEANQQILREAYLRYRVTPKPVTIVGKAVSDKAAVHTMFVDEPGSAKNTLSTKWVETLREDRERFGHALEFGERKEVQTITLEDLIQTYGTPYFVKIDVEGHEPEVLRGLHRPVPYLSFEVNLPEFQEEGQQCIARLNELDPKGRFNYTVDCQNGVALDKWLSFEEFKKVFAACKDESIEVLWASASGK
jgi:FkbM family methyltransferase